MISFVGAGPGNVDLITVKGRRLLEEADVIIYAGSLVSKEHLEFCKEGAKLYDSASMTLEEVIEVMEISIRDNLKVVRLHTGDPTIYGAIREQMDLLNSKGIGYEVIPGVSSFTAACASIKREFTLPDVSQTVILTRIEGRTPVPKEEDLESLAKHKASMAIFLSVQEIGRVVEKLVKGYGRDDIPVAVVYKATWEDEDILFGTLSNIEEKVKEKNINKMAQILVGNFIEGEYERSKLYDPSFTHKFRSASQ
ncbi:precorrin-4 C(11)-methyltransferase [Tissierella pigra]|uniref:Precorrin-4 C(11)-methyltransferase n=1 Tax=Tissierella pigra TaxID=2607614 RepID=A0A6N7XW01_9FIRM|nr:precorrin-4 C(11)-methyltransferase [Tissierella pigra]MBU5425972.1 precorrin-4 C(11)-methyltransferase [Tissierella pigra]MSU00665.1 precorrin-4 C(11)-methyltransferase [Tissierella pigra]